MYSVGVFIGNQVGGHTFLGTIMPWLRVTALEYSPPLGVIIGHYGEVKYNLIKCMTTLP